MKKAPDDREAKLFERLVSDNNVIQVGICPMMFGYRIRAGLVGDDCYYIDWCGGSDKDAVTRLYSLAATIIFGREEGREAFRDLPPCSLVKPYVLDQAFCEKIERMAREHKLIDVQVSDLRLSEIRRCVMSSELESILAPGR